MIEVVINKCYGGFGLSKEGMAEYNKLNPLIEYDWEIERDDPHLVSVVKKLGELASDGLSNLQIVEVQEAGCDISEYDGYESVCESHDT